MIPLRYRISDWSQLTKCLSNNSRDLYITVSSFLGDTLQGEFVQVNHAQYGCVFGCMVSGSGSIVSDQDDTGKSIDWLTTEQVLDQLSKFGFYVTYEIGENLSGDQLSYLMTLQALKYDHISPICVVSYDNSGSQHVERTIVAYDGAVHPEWLVVNTAVAERSLLDALSDGTAVNVSAMSKKYNFRWDWLTYVANIEDILDENAGDNPVDDL